MERVSQQIRNGIHFSVACENAKIDPCEYEAQILSKATCGKVYTYVLALTSNRYYVGITDNIRRRLKEHQDPDSDKRVLWMTKNFDAVVALIELSQEDENVKTVEYLERYGSKNVRGGSYCQVTYPDFPSRSHWPWIASEDISLSIEISTMKISEIARLHGRTERTIRFRLLRNYSDGKIPKGNWMAQFTQKDFDDFSTSCEKSIPIEQKRPNDSQSSECRIL